MANWLIKTAIHRVISWLPNRQYWNSLFQKHVTRSLEINSSQFEAKMSECSKFLESFRACGTMHDGFSVLELGTGWHPIFPIGMFLCGAKSVYTMDIDPLLSSARLKRDLELLLDIASHGNLAKLCPAHQPARLKELEALLPLAEVESPTDLLGRIGIHVILSDAQHVPLPDASVDLVTSCVVLEYIPAPVLSIILSEFHRVLKPDAVMVHRIDMADQYSFFDHSITPFNFLRFTNSQWKYLNSPLIPLTRLRLSDYERLFAAAAFATEELETTSGRLEDLRQVPLSAEFMQYEEADLLVLDAYIVSRRLDTAFVAKLSLKAAT